MSRKIEEMLKEAGRGVGVVKTFSVTDDDMKKINRYTLEPVKKEQVYAFKTLVGDNEGDDRNYMPFTKKALQNMKKLYPGKTILVDHERSASKQVARVFDAEIIEDSTKKTESGENLAELYTKNYMIRTDSNKDLIAEIAGGIKKEVSTATVASSLICSICGQDNVKKFCTHWLGNKYEGKTCKLAINSVSDVYELSFVAVPAQPRAGTAKEFNELKSEAGMNEMNTRKKKETDSRIFRARLKNAESFFNARKQEE